MLLADGRRILPRGVRCDTKESDIVRLHPDFRMIVLANRPGFPFLGNDFFASLGTLHWVPMLINIIFKMVCITVSSINRWCIQRPCHRKPQFWIRIGTFASFRAFGWKKNFDFNSPSIFSIKKPCRSRIAYLSIFYSRSDQRRETFGGKKNSLIVIKLKLKHPIFL